jgi:multiple sugar transport system substrate-binding protein
MIKRVLTRREFLKASAAVAAAGGAMTLGACAPTPASPAPTAPVASPITPPNIAKPVEIVMWNHPTFADTEAEKKFWDSMAQKFHAKNPNVTLRVEWVPWDQAFSKMSAAVAAGQVPDFTQSGAEQSIVFAAQGEVEPVDDIYKDIGVDNFDQLIKYYNYKGNHYGVPYLHGSEILFYRKDLLEQAGYSAPPKTWEAWQEAAAKVQAANKDVYGVGVDWSKGNSTQQIFICFMWGAGGVMLNPEGKVAIDSPENAQALQFYTDLGLKYKLLPEGVTALSQYVTTATPLDQMYGNGQLFSTIRFVTNAQALQSQFPEVYAKSGFAMVPSGPAGHSGAFANANPMWILKRSPNKEAVKDFLRFYMQPENLQALTEASGWLSGVKGIQTKFDNEEWFKANVDMVPWAVRVGWIYGPHPKNGTAEEAFLLGQLVQEVVVNKKSVAESLALYQKRYEEIYTA